VNKPLENPGGAAHSDVRVAIRNLLKLGSSLGMTLAIGFLIRPLLRRAMGPSAFGPYDAADNFTATWFIVLALGVDTYVRKEIPTRPQHANDFWGSVVFLRIVLSLPIAVGMALTLWITDRPPEVMKLVALLGVFQFFFVMNNSLGALLQANTTVDGLSAVSVVTKVAWAGGSLAGVWLGFGVMGIAVASALSEGVRCLILSVLCRKHLALKISGIAWTPVKVIVLATMPYYLNGIFHTVYNKVDVFLLSVRAAGRLGENLGQQETAWYGAASMLGGLAMLVTPLITGVLMPLLARAKEKSDVEYQALVRRSLELILIIAIPMSLALGLGATTWLTMMFGPAYAPAGLSLRLLSPIYVFIYVSIISSVALTLENRAWTLVVISGTGLVVNLIANLLIQGPMLDWIGASGGGAGAAAVQILTELGVSATMLVLMGRRAFDLRSVNMVVRTALVCGVVIALDWWMRQQGWFETHTRFVWLPGFYRLLVDGAAYAALVLLFKAVNPREMIAFLKDALRKKREPATT
jgi:O-antigen/teichoic acid export membrane protein